MTASMKNLVEQYRTGAIGINDISDPTTANASHDKMHAAYEVLRNTEEGWQCIMALMQDADASVRCGAAAHSLQRRRTASNGSWRLLVESWRR